MMKIKQKNAVHSVFLWFVIPQIKKYGSKRFIKKKGGGLFLRTSSMDLSVTLFCMNFFIFNLGSKLLFNFYVKKKTRKKVQAWEKKKVQFQPVSKGKKKNGEIGVCGCNMNQKYTINAIDVELPGIKTDFEIVIIRRAFS